ncbi:MAG: DUF5011 domain-containing protein [Clostridiales bacterium]|nr:DUF5011 domain-containing protein [Clostridiales bacterium]
MATRKTASKTSKKVTFDIDVDSKSSKKMSRKASKQLKKVSIGAICIAVLLLVVGAVGGYFGVKLISKNDCFVLNGNDELTLTIGQSYTDQGITAVAFGKDVSDDVIIETNLTKNDDGTYTATEEGTYYITYKVNHFKYNSIFKVQKIRLVSFVEPSVEEEMEEDSDEKVQVS